MGRACCRGWILTAGGGLLGRRKGRDGHGHETDLFSRWPLRLSNWAVSGGDVKKTPLEDGCFKLIFEDGRLK